MKQSQEQQRSIDPLNLLLLAFASLLLFPCVFAAILVRWLPVQLVKQRLFWLGIIFLGVLSVGGFLLLAHPWTSVQNQLTALFQEIIREAKTTTWNSSHLWSYVRPFWLDSLPFMPLAACISHLLTPRSTRERLLATHEDQVDTLLSASKRAQRQVKQRHIPDEVQQQVVLGLPIGKGFPTWIKKRLVILPTDELGRHGVVIGSSGSGKSVTLLRLAVLAARVLHWQVIFIDGKGDEDAGIHFVAAMKSAGIQRVKLFPAEPYNGWVGKWDALLSRLLAVEEFSDTHYRALAENVLRLALRAPGKPIRTSADLLMRLNLTNEFLLGLYAGCPEEEAYLGYVGRKDPMGVYNRYSALLSTLDGQLDGNWSYDDVDAAYISLDGLALSGVVSGLARYFVEDFASYAGQRKPKGRRVLFIFDDLGAVDANLTNMFERVRARGVSVYVSGQSDRSIAFKGMLQNAERILSSATTIILHACSHPHEILVRAGTDTIIEESSQFTNQQDTGSGSLRLSEVLKVSPNEVMQLPVGEAYVIAHGNAQRVRVLPISVDPQMLEEVSTSLTSTSFPSIVTLPTTEVRLNAHKDDKTKESAKSGELSNDAHNKQDEDFLK